MTSAISILLTLPALLPALPFWNSQKQAKSENKQKANLSAPYEAVCCQSSKVFPEAPVRDTLSRKLSPPACHVNATGPFSETTTGDRDCYISGFLPRHHPPLPSRPTSFRTSRTGPPSPPYQPDPGIWLPQEPRASSDLGCRGRLSLGLGGSAEAKPQKINTQAQSIHRPGGRAAGRT